MRSTARIHDWSLDRKGVCIYHSYILVPNRKREVRIQHLEQASNEPCLYRLNPEQAGWGVDAQRLRSKNEADWERKASAPEVRSVISERRSKDADFTTRTWNPQDGVERPNLQARRPYLDSVDLGSNPNLPGRTDWCDGGPSQPQRT
eukprot:6213473-Pleurochrysis_carterae.AAC.1